MDSELFNESEALDRIGGDPTLLVELIQIFLEDSGAQIKAVVEAAEIRDAKTLERAAHKLKGSMSLFASAEGMRPILLLNTMGRSENLERVDAACADLRRHAEALIDAMIVTKEKYAESSARRR